MARYLLAQGIPFIFLTGYDLNVIPDELVAIKRFQKPFEFRNVIGAIGSFKT